MERALRENSHANALDNDFLSLEDDDAVIGSNKSDNELQVRFFSRAY